MTDINAPEPWEEDLRLEHDWDMSLHPIDCGFDPRRHGMICVVPVSARRVKYEQLADYAGRRAARIADGTPVEIARELRRAGYQIQIQQTIKRMRHK